MSRHLGALGRHLATNTNQTMLRLLGANISQNSRQDA